MSSCWSAEEGPFPWASAAWPVALGSIWFTCCGAAWAPSPLTFGFSSLGSGVAALGVSSLFPWAAGSGDGTAAAAPSGGAAAGSPLGFWASERGTGWLGGGAPFFIVSTETVLLPDAGAVIALVACCTTSVALMGLGSTSVGSPTFDAC